MYALRVTLCVVAFLGVFAAVLPIPDRVSDKLLFGSMGCLLLLALTF